MSVKAGSLFLAALMQTLLWLAVLYADPFGMSTAADRSSEEIFLRLYPILYPGANERIEVVLIDEEQLPLKHKSVDPTASTEWPLTFDEYADLIAKVLEHKPKAVFVDLLFDTGAAHAGPMRELIDRIPPDGPPVVFADYDDSKKQMLDAIRGLPFDGKGALRGVVELTARPNHYVLGTGSGNGAASPAAVLYNTTRLPGERLDLKRKSEFLLAWGNTVGQADAADPRCAPIVADDLSGRQVAFGEAVIAGLQGFTGAADALQGEKSWERMQPCPYHPVFHPRQLYRGDTAAAGARIENAYVMIGANVVGSNDTVNSPVHGKLPGVFIHAMALDNLLKFHGPPFAESVGPLAVQVLLIFVVSFGGGLMFADSTPPQTRLAAAGGLLIGALAWFVSLGVIAATLLYFLLTYHWAPYNWGSVAAIALAVFFSRAGTNLFVLLFGRR